MRKILLKNIRRIRHLEFELPEHDSGVYLLTGANGSGKSTLLSCLAQICDKHALETFFRPGVLFSDLPSPNHFAESEVTFSTEDKQVRFTCPDGKWMSESRPPNPAELFSFASGIFAGAKPKRHARPGDLYSVKEIQSAPDRVRETVRIIFDDEKFGELQRLQAHDGSGWIYLLPEHINHHDYYFSDNNFSAGERAVIHLAEHLSDLPDHSLVLIDETEMALHPKAQRRLLHLLTNTAHRRKMLILVSTQSASLIKITDPRWIYFLDRDESHDGTLLCRTNVYPAAILGEMAFAEEILPETILLVEDAEAAMLLEAIVDKLKRILRIDFPYCKILPVGGYMQVVILLDNLTRVFPDFVRRRAVLDRDAQGPVQRALSSPERPHFDVVARNRDKIFYLPCAPEQGIVQLLEHQPMRQNELLRRYAFPNHPVNLTDVIHHPDYADLGPSSSRSVCKEKLTRFARYFSKITGEPEVFVRKKLYRYYVDRRYRDPVRLKRDYCPLIFKR